MIPVLVYFGIGLGFGAIDAELACRPGGRLETEGLVPSVFASCAVAAFWPLVVLLAIVVAITGRRVS